VIRQVGLDDGPPRPFGRGPPPTYPINDIFALADDRGHPARCNRPFAAGKISAPAGLLVAAVMLVASLLGAQALLGTGPAAVLLAYTGTTLAYSLQFKRVAVVDVVILACLYCLRLVAGSVTTGVPLSFWLLALSMFIFFSLAVAKRYAELARKIAADPAGSADGGLIPRAHAVAAKMGFPLEVRRTGLDELERRLVELMEYSSTSRST